MRIIKYIIGILIATGFLGVAFAGTTVSDDFDKSQLKDKYKLKDDKLTTKIKHKDDTKIAVSTLLPEMTLSKWDNEVDFKIKVKDAKNKKPVFEDKKIKFKDNKKEHVFYEKENAYEIETILLEKPDTNIVEYEIETKGLDFFYQPELTQEEKDEGAFRPENVIGSYAVYHSTKQGDYSKMGGKNYRVGKAFHIYRPKIIDDNGVEVWGEMNIDKGLMNIDKGLLTITISQEFLDNAVYPVVVDPTFGYLSEGASDKDLAYDAANQCWRQGKTFTLSEAGTLDKITAFLKSTASLTADAITLTVNREDSDGSGSHGLVKKIERTSVALTSSYQEFDFTASDDSLTADDYVLNAIADYNIRVRIAYDSSGVSGNVYSESSSGSSYSALRDEDPWTETASAYLTTISIYATYTAGGAEPTGQVQVNGSLKVNGKMIIR